MLLICQCIENLLSRKPSAEERQAPQTGATFSPQQCLVKTAHGSLLEVCILPEQTAVISEVVFVLLKQEQRETLFAVPHTHCCLYTDVRG